MASILVRGRYRPDPQLLARVHALQVLRMLELVTDETSLSPDVRRVVADRLRAMLR